MLTPSEVQTYAERALANIEANGLIVGYVPNDPNTPIFSQPYWECPSAESLASSSILLAATWADYLGCPYVATVVAYQPM